jgi:arginine decarboxylase
VELIRCQIAIIGQDRAFLELWSSRLNNCAQEHDNPLKLEFVAVLGIESGEQEAVDNLDLQAAILDCSSLDETPDELGSRLNRLRPELNLFGVVEPGRHQSVGTILDELFIHNERNFNRVFRVTQAFLLKRSSTPFADTLRQYVYSAKDSWNTPGTRVATV